MPFCVRISGFGSVGGAFFGSWRTNVLVSAGFGGFRPSRPVSTRSGGDFVGFGSRRPPFDTQCAFSTLLLRDFRRSGGVFDPRGTGFDPPSEGSRHSWCSFRRSPTPLPTLSDPFATLLPRVFGPLGPPNRFSTLLPARDTLSDPTSGSARFSVGSVSSLPCPNCTNFFSSLHKPFLQICTKFFCRLHKFFWQTPYL